MLTPTGILCTSAFRPTLPSGPPLSGGALLAGSQKVPDVLERRILWSPKVTRFLMFG